MCCIGTILRYLLYVTIYPEFVSTVTHQLLVLDSRIVWQRPRLLTFRVIPGVDVPVGFSRDPFVKRCIFGNY